MRKEIRGIVRANYLPRERTDSVNRGNHVNLT